MACPKRIGVLTGGGDCPGLNAVIRAVTKTAIQDHGIEVFGISDGFLGLIENRIRRLTMDDVGGIISLGSSPSCSRSASSFSPVATWTVASWDCEQLEAAAAAASITVHSHASTELERCLTP